MALTMADIENAINLSSSDDDDLPSFKSSPKQKAPKKKASSSSSSTRSAVPSRVTASRSAAGSSSSSGPGSRAAAGGSRGPVSARNIPDIHGQAAAEVADEDFDLPDWRSGDYGGKKTVKSNKAGTVKKQQWSGSTNQGSKGGSIREQLKKGIVVAREEEEEEEEEDPQRRSKDVVARLTAGTGLRSPEDYNAAVKKAPRRTDLAADDPSTLDTTEYEGDLLERNAELDYSESTAENEAAMRREVEAELAGDSFGLPDWKSGKYRNKNTKASAGIKPLDPHASDPKIKNMRQQFKEGKVALSAREQVEKAEEDRKKRACVINGCDDLAVNKRRYCAKHHNMQQYDPEMLRKAADNIRAAAGPEALPERTCSGCGKDMTGQQMVQASGRLWHPKCFACTKCKKAFPGGRFVTLSGRPYCRPCAEKQQREGAASSEGARGGKTCAGCNTAIGDRGVVALDQHWHPKCFRCVNCSKEFPGGRFVSVKSKPYCDNACFEESIGL